ncbi:LicD family protein [Ruminococcus gauvreauii]|uniref:LicD family protein n=1 Tax=Ruminococcus gauvreauii TaxID=438033 RepID=A0ABY5VEL4_9FIRM|nr:LicD family protein [Ruminococcus gauvreauii]UWP59049.1 LicD family protein [Ruminococcus gauvreauii]
MSAVANINIPHPYSEMRYYEEKFRLKETHDEMLELLLIFDTFCRKNKIYYSLADGTLLGAFRHGDFIPWDDDADVMVTRGEYDKIRKAIQKDSSVRLLKIHFLDRITAPGFDIKKVYIDLFINEDMPKSSIVFMWKKFKTQFLRTYFNNSNVRNVRHDKLNGFYKILRQIVESVLRVIAILVIGKRDIFELNDRTVAIKDHQSSGLYTRYTSRMYETSRRFNIESYNSGYVDVLFRGERLMAIKNADTFLKEMYGDYTKLLPEEKRKPEHPVNMMDSPDSCIKWYN